MVAWMERPPLRPRNPGQAVPKEERLAPDYAALNPGYGLARTMTPLK